MGKEMRALTLAAMLVGTGSLYSQNWFPQNAQWHYWHAHGVGQGHVKIQAQGDTIIAGRTARKLFKTKVIQDGFTGNINTFQIGTDAVQDSAGVIMVNIGGTVQFDTLYNMNAGIGDRWSVPFWPSPINCDSTSFILVTDTGSITLDGQSLHFIEVETHYLPVTPTITIDTIVERVGLLNNYLYPMDFCNSFTDGQEAGVLRCYSDSLISYSAFPMENCDWLPTTVHGYNSEPEKLILFPNPGNSKLNITIPRTHTRGSLRILNTQGQITFQRKVEELTTMNLNTSGWPIGYYAIQLVSPSGVSISSFWVKEH